MVARNEAQEIEAVDQRQARPDAGLAQALVGYLNFSDGRPDPRWQRQLNEAYAQVARAGASRPWDALLAALRHRLGELHAGTSAAFRDVRQASAVLDLAVQALPAYRGFHADLLAHVGDEDIFGPFFLARVLEAILQLGHDASPTPDAIVARLNDFVGHRPVALLETRPQGEPYVYERHRPLPVFLKGAGVAFGRYHDLVERTLAILGETDPALLAEASFSLDLLDELAVDLRAYDHGHPVNRRPNYVFGEWDPHWLDRDDRDRHDQARYRRYVIRKVTLDALLERARGSSDLPDDERLFEAAAVLAGTMLMAAGVSGGGPAAHDSTTTLATLLPRIARYRDAFYEQLLPRLGAAHGERLRRERDLTRQPFGAARQHLNGYLARHRATQLQQRYLALLFAEMGYPQASQAEAQRIVSVSVRLLGDILGRLASGGVLCEQGGLDSAARLLPEIEDLLRRGIGCGAFADPWNILGFQGLFPLSAAREDAIRDPRLEDLLQVVEQTFALNARLISEAAAAGQAELVGRLSADMDRLAGWWDPFATYEVSDLRRVHGGEAVRSARSVGRALAAWHDRGETTADLAFWRQCLDDFATPKAFALVVEVLLHKGDHKAALGLLVSWLGQAYELPLEDAGYSFHHLALRWMLSLTQVGSVDELPARPVLPQVPFNLRAQLVIRFFDQLEANAEEYWVVPGLRPHVPIEQGEPLENDDEDDEENRFRAAYEGVTYRDSTAGDDGAVADDDPGRPFDLEVMSDILEKRLRFLSTLARLWQVGARFLGGHAVVVNAPAGGEHRPPLVPALEGWLAAARQKRPQLLLLLDELAAHPLPEPSGNYDSLVLYDQQRVVKEQLVYATIGTCLDMTLAIAAVRGALGGQGTEPDAPPWEADAIRLERALFAGDASAARAALAGFVGRFRAEPLLFTPLSEGPDGGEPRAILRARTAQAVLRGLLANLPRLGLLRETYELLRSARAMEQAQQTPGRGVTEFNYFFQSAYQAVVENVVRSSASWGPEQGSDDHVVALLNRITAPFLALWIEHSRTLQLSVLEGVAGDGDRAQGQWRGLVEFVRAYGSELFHARFLTLSNLRGVLHRGVDAYLDYLRDNADPLKPSRLIEDLERGTLRREDAVRRLELVLQAVIENYEEYKDYNTTTTQSDYGENLHVLLDFLRLKVTYDRQAWQFRPLVLAHEVLARHGRPTTALRWEESLVQFTRELAKQHLDNLGRLERQHGVRLGTISDRLSERFVKPLALDRLCAVIEPCLDEARRIERESDRPSFQRLREELRAYTASPTGVGLDVPAWLRRLEAEVRRVQASRTSMATLAENFFRVPRRSVSHDDVQRELREWERPALPR
jgi:hypothetical protein